MTLRSRLRRRLLAGVAGAIAGAAGLGFAGAAHAAYTPGVQQYADARGCASPTTITGCTKTLTPVTGGGVTRVDADLYVSSADSQGSEAGLFHYRRTSTGLELRSCLVAQPSAQATQLGCEVVALLPRFSTRPAVAEDAVYVGGSAGDAIGTWSGVVAAVARDADSGELTADGATCRVANAADAPACTSAGLDRLGGAVVEVVVAPDGSTVHALATTGPETQLVTYSRASNGALDPASCLANVDVVCTLPPVDERPLLSGASEMVIAPDGSDIYLAASRGLVHLARIASTGQLVVDDCVGDGEDVVGLCDKGPGDFLHVSRLSMTSDDQVIAIASGDDSVSVVRLLRDASGTLTEAGCIGTAEEDGCGTAPGVFNPTMATATPDEKNVIVSGSAGDPVVTLIAGGAAGLRKLPGTSGCVSVDSAAAPSGCAAEVRGSVRREANALRTEVLVGDEEVTVSTDGSLLFFARGRAPGCLQRTATAQRPSGALSLVCSDPNGDPVVLVIGRSPAHGTLDEISQNSSSVVFTPNDTYEGADSFTYGAGDGTFTSSATLFNLTLPTGPNTVKPDTDPGKGGGGATGPGGEVDPDVVAGTDPAPVPSDPPTLKTPPSPGGGPGTIDLRTVGKHLTVSSKRIVAFKLTCRGAAGAPACKGALRVAAASRLVVDGKRQVVTFGRKDYAIPPGATFTVSLRLPAKLAALITKKKPVAATVLAIGTGPSSVGPVQAKVTLKR